MKNTDFVTFYNLQNVGTKFSKKIILTNLFPTQRLQYSGIKWGVPKCTSGDADIVFTLHKCYYNYDHDDQALLPLSQVLWENVFLRFITICFGNGFLRTVSMSKKRERKFSSCVHFLHKT